MAVTVQKLTRHPACALAAPETRQGGKGQTDRQTDRARGRPRPTEGRAVWERCMEGSAARRMDTLLGAVVGAAATAACYSLSAASKHSGSQPSTVCLCLTVSLARHLPLSLFLPLTSSLSALRVAVGRAASGTWRVVSPQPRRTCTLPSQRWTKDCFLTPSVRWCQTSQGTQTGALVCTRTAPEPKAALPTCTLPSLSLSRARSLALSRSLARSLSLPRARSRSLSLLCCGCADRKNGWPEQVLEGDWRSERVARHRAGLGGDEHRRPAVHRLRGRHPALLHYR